MMTRYLILIIVTLSAFRSIAADSYLCISDLTTGFAFDKEKKAWESVNFREQQKFIISRANQKTHAWEIKQVGSSRSEAVCEKDFNDAESLFCKGFFDLRFNRKNLRFLYFNRFGYWDEGVWGDTFPDIKEGDNTPAIGIGKCSPL